MPLASAVITQCWQCGNTPENRLVGSENACYTRHSHFKTLTIKRKEERKMTDFIKAVEAKPNEKIPQMNPGDTVSVHVKIKEGDRERIQEFKGIVIRLRKSGNDASVTVRRMATNGIGVERTFLLRSPRIDKVVVERHGKVRRAQLYFMRERTGKSARLKQKFD
jgi:large subunit ribosomal protein L19